jgi:hypothetical protein
MDDNNKDWREREGEGNIFQIKHLKKRENNYKKKKKN